MDSPEPAPSTPPRRRRRWPIVIGLVLLVPIAPVAAIPSLLNTRAGNAFVAGRLDRMFAPGRLRFDSIRFSWTASTRLSAVRLEDTLGKPVVIAAEATLSPGLWDLIMAPTRLGTLALRSAAFEVERRGDGSIDLAEALEGIFRTKDPRRDLTIRADAATLSLRAPGLAPTDRPDAMDLIVRLRPAPESAAWSVALARGPGQAVKITGDVDRWRSRATSRTVPDLNVNVEAKDWSVATTARGIEASGRLDGNVEARRVGGGWRVEGTASVQGLRAEGPALRGDALDLASVDLAGAIALVDGRVAVERLAVETPLGRLAAIPPTPADGPGSTRVEGTLDLPAIARALPRALRLRDGLAVERGTARLTVVARAGPGRPEWSVEADVSDLAGRRDGRAIGLRGPARLSALVARVGASIAVDHLDLATGFLAITARGDLDAGVVVGGTLDLAAFRLQATDWIDLGGVDLAGKAGLSARYQRTGSTYAADSRLDVEGLRLVGVGPSPIRADRALMTLDARGEADPSGLPTSIAGGHFGVDSGGLAVAIDVRRETIGTAVDLRAGGPSTIGTRPARAEGSLAGRWDGASRSLTIDALRLGLRPDGAGAGPDPASLAWSGSGRLDLAEGTLSLRPSGPADPSSAIALGPDGLTVSGLGRPGRWPRVEAAWGGDLGALDRLLAGWSGRAARDLAGTWTASVAVTPGDDGTAMTARVAVADLSWPGPGGEGRRRAGGPLVASAATTYRHDLGTLELAELAVITPIGRAEATGRVEAIGGPSRVDLAGTLAPDWRVITAILADRVEPGAKIEGGSRAFRVRGPLRPDLNAGPPEPTVAEAGIALAEADLFGMRLEATPIVVRARGRSVAVDPIETKLNDGRLRLAAVVDLDAEGGPVLRLDEGSSLADATVNEEVSRRVLSYVAPVLDRTTRASGRLSVAIEDAEFPLSSDAGKKANVTGSVAFQDVEFAPGPLARQVIGLVSPREPTSLRLDAPILLSIADGRVNQKGLALPIGPVARVEIEGWVDFDRNIALVASLPVTPAMFPNSPLLGGIVDGTAVRVPIGGTLARPQLDKDAFNAGLKDLGRTLLTRGAGLGALDLLSNLARPRVRDPDAPPPPTPEERKARRMEKKNQRRRARGLDPLPGPP